MVTERDIELTHAPLPVLFGGVVRNNGEDVTIERKRAIRAEVSRRRPETHTSDEMRSWKKE